MVAPPCTRAAAPLVLITMCVRLAPTHRRSFRNKDLRTLKAANRFLCTSTFLTLPPEIGAPRDLALLWTLMPRPGRRAVIVRARLGEEAMHTCLVSLNSISSYVIHSVKILTVFTTASCMTRAGPMASKVASSTNKYMEA